MFHSHNVQRTPGHQNCMTATLDLACKKRFTENSEVQSGGGCWCSTKHAGEEVKGRTLTCQTRQSPALELSGAGPQATKNFSLVFAFTAIQPKCNQLTFRTSRDQSLKNNQQLHFICQDPKMNIILNFEFSFFTSPATAQKYFLNSRSSIIELTSRVQYFVR